MSRRVAAGFTAWLLIGQAHAAPAQEPFEIRLVVGTDVVCRAQPDRDSPVVSGFTVGDALVVRARTEDGRNESVWYEVSGLRSPCWVFGPLTVALDGFRNPDRALIAIAEHALALDPSAPFEHLVAVDNVLLERKYRHNRYFGAPETVSPLLELRHLQIVERAARAVGGRRDVRRAPLRMAWLLAHSDVVFYFEPAGLYVVRGASFWELYERFRPSSVAEEIAWTAAETPIFTDECYTACRLSMLAESYGRYWTEFPRGRYTAEAVAKGVRAVEGAARYCPDVAAGSIQEPPGRIRDLTRRLRESLSNVDLTAKASLLTELVEIEETCLG